MIIKGCLDKYLLRFIGLLKLVPNANNYYICDIKNKIDDINDGIKYFSGSKKVSTGITISPYSFVINPSNNLKITDLSFTGVGNIKDIKITNKNMISINNYRRIVL